MTDYENEFDFAAELRVLEEIEATDLEDLEELTEMFDDEMGFDPYEGCYTWDC